MHCRRSTEMIMTFLSSRHTEHVTQRDVQSFGINLARHGLYNDNMLPLMLKHVLDKDI